MPNNRLRQLRKERNLSQKDVAERIHIPTTTYSGYENNKREPNSEMLITLADFFNCSVDYLIGKETNRINDDVLDRVNELDLDALSYYGNILDAQKENELIKKYRTLDEYGRDVVDNVAGIEAKRCEKTLLHTVFTFRRLSENKASAGCGYDLNNPDVWKEIDVVDTPEARQADFAVEVEGASMEPDYHDGDIVYISLASEVPVGQVGLFIKDGMGYIKEAGNGCLISRNPDYENIYPSDENIECKGRVIGIAELAE